jgi:undecaprenyl-phosphate 4-deoxy-4-formamido-L-arabinose transferase
MKKLSFVIPCYRSENTIRIVVEELMATVEKRGNSDYEIILVNDNSPDNVFKIIAELASQYPQVKGIELAKNFGQHSALMAGYHFAFGDIVVSLDDDGQTPANEVFTLIDKLDEETDVVIAKYAVTTQHSLFRKFGTRVNKIMAEIFMGKPKHINITSFLACKKFIIDEMLRYENAYPNIAGLLYRATNRIINVPLQQKERISGKSGYSLHKLVSLWMNGFTAFSIKPLRFATYMGIFTAFIGFVYGVTVIIRKIINPGMQAGYASLMSVLLFISGMILFLLGMMGEYVGRIYISINNAPQYVIRRKININVQKNAD